MTALSGWLHVCVVLSIPRGLRGYEIRILKSEDGIKFKKVHAIKREKVPIPGFERPALLIDPELQKNSNYMPVVHGRKVPGRSSSLMMLMIHQNFKPVLQNR